MTPEPQNSPLFSGEPPKEITLNSYYAYLDTIEQISGNYHLKFDCIEKQMADVTVVTEEFMVSLPSIVIDVVGELRQIQEMMKYSNLYLLESQWMVISTTLDATGPRATQSFNFVSINDETKVDSYALESVIRGKNIDGLSRVKIDEIIEITKLDESNIDAIGEFCESIDLQSFSHVNIYNVGQGNFNALVNEHNQPLLYFDMGGGRGAYKASYPPNFKLCHTNSPPVVLSHWDEDHVISAVYNPKILDSKWLVPPHSSISKTAWKIATVLKSNGNLTVWNSSLSTPVAIGPHLITKCTGKAHNKNNSGLAMFVNYSKDEYVLLPGDAAYNKIPDADVKDLIGLVASHHGSLGVFNRLGAPIAHSPYMLVYSASAGNAHHPNKYARNIYKKGGWNNCRETCHGSIQMKNVPSNISVPCMGGACTLGTPQHF
jgi:hypothetical protein